MIVLISGHDKRALLDRQVKLFEMIKPLKTYFKLSLHYFKYLSFYA